MGILWAHTGAIGRIGLNNTSTVMDEWAVLLPCDVHIVMMSSPT